MLHPVLSRIAAVLLAVCAALAFAAPAAAAPPSAAVFGKLPAVSSMSLSPDGKLIAGIVSPNGRDTYVAVWKTDAPSEPPKLTPAPPKQRLMGVNFIKNDRLVVRLKTKGDAELEIWAADRHAIGLTDVFGVPVSFEQAGAARNTKFTRAKLGRN
jgi:hypothetical protein